MTPIRRFVSSTLARGRTVVRGHEQRLQTGPIEEHFFQRGRQAAIHSTGEHHPDAVGRDVADHVARWRNPNFRLSGKLADIDSATHSLRRDRFANAVAATYRSEGGRAAEWDYVMPDGFLPLIGGTLSLGTIDRWDYGEDSDRTAYSALYRSGGIGVYRSA